MLSTVLVMVQPTCMLVISSFQISNFFFDGDSNPNALVPNTTTGWLIQVFCTYLGYVTLFVGVFWTTKLHVKIAKKWREIRTGEVLVVEKIAKTKTETPQAGTVSQDAQPKPKASAEWNAFVDNLYEEQEQQPGSVSVSAGGDLLRV